MNSDPTHEDLKLDLSAPGMWQRLPGESVNSCAAFCAYLELGPDATLQRLSDQSGKSLDVVCQLSARHHWMERAAAYRQHLANATPHGCSAPTRTASRPRPNARPHLPAGTLGGFPAPPNDLPP